MKDSFKVSYVTTLPKIGNAPMVTITGNEDKTYKVFFMDLKDNSLVSSGTCKTNQTISAGSRQWFTKWYIEVHDEFDMMVFNDTFVPTYGKTVFIKIDSYALGDTIAWIPYVEAFRRKYKCNVICSTFHNHLFIDALPEIMFVQPNTTINNVYAQYYIGAAYDNNPKYCRLNAAEHPLQKIASDILGLEYEELRIDIGKHLKHKVSYFKERHVKYVTLSEFGSAPNKEWKLEGGWQWVVDYLRAKNFVVVVISKEKTSLTGVVDKSGDYPLEDRMIDMMGAEMHFGVSSGLSWLAWSVGTPVFMISDISPKFHEFSSNITRLGGDDLQAVNYSPDSQTSLEKVLEKIGELELA